MHLQASVVFLQPWTLESSLFREEMLTRPLGFTPSLFKKQKRTFNFYLVSRWIDLALAEHLLNSTHSWAAHSFYHIVNAAQDTKLSKISLIQLVVNSVPTVISFCKEFIIRNHKTVLFWWNWWEKPMCVCPWGVSSKAWQENWDAGFQAKGKRMLHWATEQLPF